MKKQNENSQNVVNNQKDDLAMLKRKTNQQRTKIPICVKALGKSIHFNPSKNPNLSRHDLPIKQNKLHIKKIKYTEIKSDNVKMPYFVEVIQDQTAFSAIYVILPILACFIFVYFHSMQIFLTNIIGLVYPIYWSLKALDPMYNKPGDKKQWLTYWTLYLVNLPFDISFGKFLKYIPLYYTLRYVFLCWMFLPNYNGATLIYDKIIVNYLPEMKIFIKIKFTYENVKSHFSNIIEKIKSKILGKTQLSQIHNEKEEEKAKPIIDKEQDKRVDHEKVKPLIDNKKDHSKKKTKTKNKKRKQNKNYSYDFDEDYNKIIDKEMKDRQAKDLKEEIKFKRVENKQMKYKKKKAEITLEEETKEKAAEFEEEKIQGDEIRNKINDINIDYQICQLKSGNNIHPTTETSQIYITCQVPNIEGKREKEEIPVSNTEEKKELEKEKNECENNEENQHLEKQHFSNDQVPSAEFQHIQKDNKNPLTNEQTQIIKDKEVEKKNDVKINPVTADATAKTAIEIATDVSNACNESSNIGSHFDEDLKTGKTKEIINSTIEKICERFNENILIRRSSQENVLFESLLDRRRYEEQIREKYANVSPSPLRAVIENISSNAEIRDNKENINVNLNVLPPKKATSQYIHQKRFGDKENIDKNIKKPKRHSVTLEKEKENLEISPNIVPIDHAPDKK